MKKIKFTRQFNLAYAMAFLVMLLAVNYVFYQSQVQTHREQQQKLSEFIILTFSSGLEYGLSFGNKTDLEQTLFPLRNNTDIAYVKVVDNQGTTVAQVDNRALIGISQTVELHTVNKDIAQTLGTDLQSNFPQELLDSYTNSNRRLGQIQIATTPYKFSRQYNGITYLFLNIALGVPLVLFWIYLFIRQAHQAKIVKALVDLLNNSESYKEFKETVKTNEGSELLSAVEQQVIKTQNLRHKLNLLKSEVQQARLDANTELHEFIGFMTQQDFNSSVNNLMLFYDIIKQPVDKVRHAVWCHDLLTQSLVELSPLAQKHNTLIQDSFTGNRMNHKIHIDENAFKQMLRLLLQQLIAICEDETLAIHFDLRQDYQDTANLRISFSSKAAKFLEGIEKQSLFQFKEELPVTVHSNNIQLISAKHLIKKLGGEYLYFSDEVRLEIPITTLSVEDKKIQPEVISPLGINLKVIVYDSDPIDKMVLLGYLGKLGADVDKATTKQVVLQKLRHDNYDAILVNSDFISDDPTFSFSNFLEEIKQLDSQPHIIIVSRDFSITESENFQKLGSAQFITKPVEPKKLGEMLSSL